MTSMKTYDQLQVLTETLERCGWERLNGNTWCDRARSVQLITGYAHQEATLKVITPIDRVHGWIESRTNYYRGSEPLTWIRSIKHGIWGFEENLPDRLDTSNRTA